MKEGYYTVGHARLQQFPVYLCLLLTHMCFCLCVCLCDIYDRKLKIHALFCAAYFLERSALAVPATATGSHATVADEARESRLCQALFALFFSWPHYYDVRCASVASGST